jgi:HAD superfamily hydrolase (TIGR01484 family)
VEKKFSDLFAFDLDGTLVHTLSPGVRGIPPELLSVVHELSQRAHVVIATGRRYRSALDDIRKLPRMPYAISNNGLVIRDDRHQVVLRQQLSDDEALSISKILKNELIDYFFVGDGFDHKIDYLFSKDRLQLSDPLRRVLERVGEHCEVLEEDEALKHFSHVPLLEVAALQRYEELLRVQKILMKQLPAHFKVIVVKNIGYEGLSALEIFKSEHSKWSGVQWVAEKLKATRIITAGDDENDLEMLRSADVGIVMSHAEEHIRSVGSAEVEGPLGLTKFLREFYKL